jgi:LPS-assembly protein
LKNKTKLLYLLLALLGSHSSRGDDWIPLPACESLCEGYYAYTPSPVAFSADSFRNLPISITADETEYAFDGTSRLEGNVTLIQGEHYLHADEVEVTRSTLDKQWDALVAKGHILFTMPGVRITGDEAIYRHNEKQIDIDNTEYRWYAKQARGKAAHINVCQNEKLTLKQADYTTCSPMSDTWILKADEITIYPKRGRATAKHVHLDWYDMPIFYMPYFTYPVDNKRHSGFLFPTYGTTSFSGNEITIPYYWNIAPNYDLTFIPGWLSERGSEFRTQFRYLWPYGEGILEWHILPHDRKYGHFSQVNRISPPGGLAPSDPRILALDTGPTRSAFHYHHASQFGERWVFNAIFDYVTDDNFFADLGNDIHTSSTIQLPQTANLTYYGNHWTHYFNVEEYQVLEPLSQDINDEIYKRQPQWLFLAVYPDLWFDLTFALDGEAVSFAHRPDLLTQSKVTIGQRYHLRPSLTLPLEDTWYFFKPRYQLDWLSYDLSLGEFSNTLDLPRHPTRTIPLYDLDTGLIFERDLQYKKYCFTQTLEPRAYYLYVPYRNQNLYPNFDSGIINFSYGQLFRDNRFSGRDRVGDANQLTLNLTTRLIPAEGGKEWLRASVGEIIYFSPQRVFLCEEVNDAIVCVVSEAPETILGQDGTTQSNLIAQADINPHPYWSASLYWQWDPSVAQTEQAAANIQYHPSPQKIININYYWELEDFGQFNPQTFTMESLNQGEISVFWPLTMRWQVLARWHYDFINRQTLEMLGGFEYNGCCMAFQLIGSRYLVSDNFFYPDPYANGVMFQVVFKGLSAIGYNHPDSELKKKIPGYQPLFNRQQQLSQPPKKFFPPHEVMPY